MLSKGTSHLVEFFPPVVGRDPQESNQGKQLHYIVHHRCSCHTQSILRVEMPCRKRCFRIFVLNALCFIKNDAKRLGQLVTISLSQLRRSGLTGTICTSRPAIRICRFSLAEHSDWQAYYAPTPPYASTLRPACRMLSRPHRIEPSIHR